MTREEIGKTVSSYISKNFLFDATRKIGGSDSLLGTGVVDSTGILELITFLETTYNVKFLDSELTADNFDSIDKIQSFISKKLS
jgi:acyl carrier protein